MILIGVTSYVYNYRNKEKPQVGIKRNSFYEYFVDYINLKKYHASIAFMAMGVAILLVIAIIELVS